MKTGDSTRPLPGELATATLPAAHACSSPATPRDAGRRVPADRSCSLLGRRSSTSTGDRPASVFRYNLFAANREVAGLGERVAEIAREERVFEVVGAAGRLAEQHDARLARGRWRQPGELLFDSDEVRREPFDAAFAEHVGQHPRHRDAVLQREAAPLATSQRSASTHHRPSGQRARSAA